MAKSNTVNRKFKDSVSIRLFQDKSRILQLYRELHPEATDVTGDDIEVKTLKSVIVNTRYNDLGFTLKNKFVLLVEIQSS